MSSVCHFFDKESAKLYLDSGVVLNAGDPQWYTQFNSDELISKLELLLRKKGVIGQQDYLMWLH